MNAAQYHLREMIWSAHSYSMEELHAAEVAVIDGHLVQVAFHAVARKCYDFLPVPTLQIKVDGRVTAKAAAFSLLA